MQFRPLPVLMLVALLGGMVLLTEGQCGPQGGGTACKSWRDCEDCNDPNYRRSCNAGECLCIAERPCQTYKDCLPCYDTKQDRTCYSSFCHCVYPNEE